METSVRQTFERWRVKEPFGAFEEMAIFNAKVLDNNPDEKNIPALLHQLRMTMEKIAEAGPQEEDKVGALMQKLEPA